MSRLRLHSPAAARALLAVLVPLWVGAFIATHIPAHYVPPVHLSDKTLHGGGYFVLGGVFALALAARGVRRLPRVCIVLATLAAYGAFDEITQPLVNRTASAEDWLADVLGAAAALALCEAAGALWPRRRTDSAA